MGHNNVTILHCFQDITSLTVYMTVCDLEKCFSFEVMVQIIGHIWFWFVCEHIPAIMCYMLQDMGFRRASISWSDFWGCAWIMEEGEGKWGMGVVSGRPFLLWAA